MRAAEILERLGGVATWSELSRHAGRAEIAQAVRGGAVILDARGKYALPGADEALRAASRLSGVVSHRSAAVHWGWAQAKLPTCPEITVPKHRKIAPDVRRQVSVHFVDLSHGETDSRVTSRSRTIGDLLRSEDTRVGLAVADSALRAGDFTGEGLNRLVGHLRGPGSARARAVAAQASELSANPFESVLRSLAIEAGLQVRPQVPLYAHRFLGRPDLVDADRRLILEADSFRWHGTRGALVRDSRRYNEFVLSGWRVLRFSWEDVMLRPHLVLETLECAAQKWTEAG